MEAEHGKEGEKRDPHTGSLRNETECWDKNSPVPGKFSSLLRLETGGAALLPVRPSEVSGKEHSSLWREVL